MVSNADPTARELDPGVTEAPQTSSRPDGWASVVACLLACAGLLTGATCAPAIEDTHTRCGLAASDDAELSDHAATRVGGGEPDHESTAHAPGSPRRAGWWDPARPRIGSFPCGLAPGLAHAKDGMREGAQPASRPDGLSDFATTRGQASSVRTQAAGAPSPAVASAVHDPWPGAATVTVAQLLDELDRVATALESDPVVLSEFAALAADHALAGDDAQLREYTRVRLVFEATRDGGPWGLRWDITNRSPNSKSIWAQWREGGGQREGEVEGVTAVAECDELSALFAFLARKLGVRKVGLFWPQWNHVVAVWMTPGVDGTPRRVVVPTSQIFLDEIETLGTRGFDPWRQKTIYNYGGKDIELDAQLDARLARRFVAGLGAWVALPSERLQARRNTRSRRQGGS